MSFAKSNFARRLWTVRQALFPSFERKRYHLQFRHAVLITIMLMCAAFTMPAYHQTPPWPRSDYTTSAAIPVEESYNLVHRFLFGIMYYNVAMAAFIALHLVTEPQFHRGAPVWFEITWMTLLMIGEVVCLGLMASSRPDVCNFHFGVDPTFVSGKFSARNSATSICSNWRGMIGMLATITGLFLLHVTWHVVVSLRHRSVRKSVFTLPITDYRWKLPKPLERINEIFPGDIEAPPMSETEKGKQADSAQYTSGDYTFKSTQTDTLNLPITSISSDEDYSNFSRPAAPKLHALPVTSKPVVIKQSTVTQSDTSSIVESDHAGSSPKESAPFTYASRI